jgi:arylsulfatase A-like enzyme
VSGTRVRTVRSSQPCRSLERLCRVARALAICITLAGIGCGGGPTDTRPSIFLVVIDTLRIDAVSAYGAVDGTTPDFDRLAADGLLYRRAYAPSPWTLPSHASLLTGLRIDQHRVGAHGATALPEEVVTIAERLRDAGYETVGFAENPLVSEPFLFSQGFETYVSSAKTRLEQFGEKLGQPELIFEVVEEVEKWAKGRRQSRPFFVFLNLYDPHSPYEVREVNRFLPDGVTQEEARLTAAGSDSAYRICERIPAEPHIRILRGLYLGDVLAADVKLGAIWRLLRNEALPRPLISTVTSDHGEHFGEHRLLDHEFSVRNAVLSVPLLVHGLPGATPASIAAPVQLADISASVLEWAGLEIPPGLHGRALPSTPAEAAASERDVISFYSDEKLQLPSRFVSSPTHAQQAKKRAACGPRDRVFGNMAALIRYPLKLTWFERYPPELYDLSWDPEERFDLSTGQPEVARMLREEVESFIEETGLTAPPLEEVPEANEEAIQMLRMLGYVE